MSIVSASAPLIEPEVAALLGLLPHAGCIVLAVSGGADSTALMVLAQGWRSAREKRGEPTPELIAATVDHGLRPQSRAEAEWVAGAATRCGVPHEILAWTGPKPKSGLEQAARSARRRLLIAFARRHGANHVVTAHTLDDQAETVLMRLAAGSGPSGLAGMRPAQDWQGVTFLRPFLSVCKGRLVATLRNVGIDWLEDPMNADLSFARPRLRAARAVLTREGLTPERLGRLAERMARYEEVVAGAAAVMRPNLRHCECPDGWDADALLAAPTELALRLLADEIARVSGPEAQTRPIRLGRLEALWQDVRAAIASRRTARRTLAGALITVARGRCVRVTAAPPRRTRPTGRGANQSGERSRGAPLGIGGSAV